MSLYAASSASHVDGPTRPSATSPLDRWNAFTALSVFGPKSLSGTIFAPFPASSLELYGEVAAPVVLDDLVRVVHREVLALISRVHR